MRRKFKSVLVLLVGVLLLSVPGIVEAASTSYPSVKKSNGHLNHTWGHTEDTPDKDWYVLNDRDNRYYIGADIKAHPELKKVTTKYSGWFTHDKKIAPTGTVCWFTKGFVATLSEVNKVSEGALNPDGSKLEFWYDKYKHLAPSSIKSSKNFETEGFLLDTVTGCPLRHSNENSYDTYVDSAFLFKNKEVMRWGMSAGAKFDENGEMVYYLQPIIGIKTRPNSTTANWTITGEEYRTLTGWENARSWRNSSTFKDHYNKKLTASYQIEGETKISYKTMDGQEISFEHSKKKNSLEGVNAGATLKYTDAGLLESFKGTVGGVEYTWLLAGVEVNRDPNNEGYVVGTHGTLKTKCESGSIAILDKLYSPATATINDIPTTSTAKAKWKITTNGDSYNSQFYTFMKDRKFQCTLDTQITYYYVRVPEKVKINFVAAYKFEEGCRYVPVNPDGSIG